MDFKTDLHNFVECLVSKLGTKTVYIIGIFPRHVLENQYLMNQLVLNMNNEVSEIAETLTVNQVNFLEKLNFTDLFDDFHLIRG